MYCTDITAELWALLSFSRNVVLAGPVDLSPSLGYYYYIRTIY